MLENLPAEILAALAPAIEIVRRQAHDAAPLSREVQLWDRTGLAYARARGGEYARGADRIMIRALGDEDTLLQLRQERVRFARYNVTDDSITPSSSDMEDLRTAQRAASNQRDESDEDEHDYDNCDDSDCETCHDPDDPCDDDDCARCHSHDPVTCCGCCEQCEEVHRDHRNWDYTREIEGTDRYYCRRCDHTCHEDERD
jgi:hypothetical protein